MDYPRKVFICEVGPRDGFQMEDAFIPTDTKVDIINALARTGIKAIQATSFVHPQAVPQMRDAAEVLALIDRLPGVLYSALVPNEKGAERAIAAEVDRVDVVVSVSRSHSLSNVRMEPKQAMERARLIVGMAEAAGVVASIGFATALGCPFEGFPEYERVEAMVGRAVTEFGYRQVTIADTVGMANPGLVRSTLSRLRARFPHVQFTLHLHDTRRMGLANMVAGLEAGIDHFDSSIAGLGGCPFAPGATGNISTEDSVNMLASMGIETGIDLEAVVDVGHRVRGVVGHADSGVLRAGTSFNLLGPYQPA